MPGKLKIIFGFIFWFIFLGFRYLQIIDAREDVQARMILQESSKTISSIQSYRCVLSTICRLGKKEERRVYNYAFKKQKLIRMDIVAGSDRGSVLVYRDGLVRGRKGGLLSFITLTFKPSDRTVTTIRGGRIDQTDFGFILNMLLDPRKQVIWKGKESFLGQEADLLELLETKAIAAGQPVRGLFWIARDSKLILKYELYDKDDNLLFQQVHKEIQLNIDFPQKYFRL